MYLGIGAAAEFIGVSISTLRRWEQENYYLPCYRTKGGHRRYSIESLKKRFLNTESSSESKITIAYARVSSHDQKLDLERQKKRLSHYCEQQQWNYTLISDLGSGLSAPSKAWYFQRVKFPSRKVVEPPHLEPSLELPRVTVSAKRRQGDMQAVTKVKRNEPRKTINVVVDSFLPLEDKTICSLMARTVGCHRGLSAQHA